jgi:hypothetical protein
MNDATFGAPPRVPAQVLPPVPMATHVDLTITAIDRDRIAYVAFSASLNKADGGEAALDKVAKSHNSVRTLTKPPAAAKAMSNEPPDGGV